MSLLCCQIVQLFKVRRLGNGLPVPVMRLLCYVPVMRGLLHTLQIRVTLLLVLAVNKLVNANNDFAILGLSLLVLAGVLTCQQMLPGS